LLDDAAQDRRKDAARGITASMPGARTGTRPFAFKIAEAHIHPLEAGTLPAGPLSDVTESRIDTTRRG
jgi:hypothetical protein